MSPGNPDLQYTHFLTATSYDTRQESMPATLDLLIQPLQEDNSPRVIVGSSTLIEQQLQLHELDVSNPQQP